MVTHFYTCSVVKKCINIIAMALYLAKVQRVACRSGHQKSGNMGVAVKEW